MQPKIIKKHGKPEAVIISYSDYQLFLKLKSKDLASSKKETAAKLWKYSGTPPEVSRRLQKGESPVRAWRLCRDLAQKDLAAQAGVSKTTLSFIENRVRPAAYETLESIAKVLKVPVKALLDKAFIEYTPKEMIP